MFSDGEVFLFIYFFCLFLFSRTLSLLHLWAVFFEMQAQMYKSFCTYVVYVYSIKCCCDPFAHVLI